MSHVTGKISQWWIESSDGEKSPHRNDEGIHDLQFSDDETTTMEFLGIFYGNWFRSRVKNWLHSIGSVVILVKEVSEKTGKSGDWNGKKIIEEGRTTSILFLFVVNHPAIRIFSEYFGLVLTNWRILPQIRNRLQRTQRSSELRWRLSCRITEIIFSIDIWSLTYILVTESEIENAHEYPKNDNSQFLP